MRRIALVYELLNSQLNMDPDYEYHIAFQMEQIARTCPSLVALAVNFIPIYSSGPVRYIIPRDRSLETSLDDIGRVMTEVAKQLKVLRIVYFGTVNAYNKILHRIAPAEAWTEQIYRGSTDRSSDTYFCWPEHATLSCSQIDQMRLENGLLVSKVTWPPVVVMSRELQEIRERTGNIVFEKEIRAFALKREGRMRPQA